MFKPYGAWDTFVVLVANLILRLSSQRYRDTLDWIVELGFSEADKINNETVTNEVGNLTTSPDAVDSEVEGQESLIDEGDVDTTARFIHHPTWNHFGDELKENS